MLSVQIHLAVLVILLIILQQSTPSHAGRMNRIDDFYPPLSFVDGQERSYHQRRASLWSKLFRDNQRKMPLSPEHHELHIRNAVIHLIPNKKRTIPLELQKALYAHGIVGRRR